MKLKQILHLNLLLLLNLLLTTCNSVEPPPPPPGEKPTLTLKQEDASCTETWITLTTTNLQLPAAITLKQNYVVRDTINLSKADTLLYIDSLLPNQTYSFVASHSGLSGISSNELSVTTMDTTSHNFTFETFTFGGTAGSSTLYDVAIINENNIWAVGEIPLPDSTLGEIIYNAIHWDGNEWKLKKIPFLYHGDSLYGPIYSVFTFGQDDIWFGMGNMVHWNGVNYIPISTATAFSSIVNRIWGRSSNDLYIVGNDGHIAHFNGTIWQRIESGTGTRINDVWGIISNENNAILYCPVSSFFVSGDKKILKIVDGNVDSVSWGRDIRLYSAWTSNENFLYVCGEGAYVNKFGIWSEINLYPVGTNSIRGNDINDILIVGDYGSIFHFNGVGWQMLSTPNNKGYSKVAIQNNLVVVCGNYQGQALVEIGRRN